MRINISLLWALFVCIALVSAGCNSKTETKDAANAPAKLGANAKPSETAKKPKAADKAAPSSDDKTPDADPEPEANLDTGAQVVIEKEVPRGDGVLTPTPLDSEKPVVPVVQMTEQHAATCLVKVGDALPAGELPDLAGKNQELSKLFGEKLTIVVFFREGQDESTSEIADLAAGVASPLAGRGVKVIGVCERGAAESTREICQKAGVSYPVLLDADGAYFARLATGKMPRTYLVDPLGKVLWFDIDYSRGTRHDLREALRALVAK